MENLTDPEERFHYEELTVNTNGGNYKFTREEYIYHFLNNKQFFLLVANH